MSFHSELRWHNTVARDFHGGVNPATYVNPAKRSAAVAFTANIDGASELAGQGVENSQTAVMETPSKKRKALSNIAQFTTPVKPKANINDNTGTIMSASSGIQTPPPSGTLTKRKRGRPPKNPLAPPKPPSMTKAAKGPKKSKAGTSAASTPSSTSVGLESNGQMDGTASETTPRPRVARQIEEGNPFIAADASVRKMGTEVSENIASNATGVNLPAVTSADILNSSSLDWSLLSVPGDGVGFEFLEASLKSSNQSKTDNSTSQIFSDEAINQVLSEQNPLSELSSTSPLGVNPNWIFASSEAGKRGFDEELAHLQPYRQQYIQLQQEQLDHAEKKLQKAQQPANKSGQPIKRPRGRPRLKKSASDSVISNPPAPTPVPATVPAPASTSVSAPSQPPTQVADETIKPLKSTQNPKTIPTTTATTNDENTNPSSPPCSTVADFSAASSSHWTGSVRTRTSVNLAISPGGRAKAETILLEDSDSDEFGGFDIEEDPLEGYDTDSSTDVDESILNSFSNSISRSFGSRLMKSARRNSPSKGPFRPKLSRFDTAPARLNLTPSGSAKKRRSILANFNANSELTPGRMTDESPSKVMKVTPKAFRSARRRTSVSSVDTFSSPCKPPLTPNLASMCEESDHSEAETVLDGRSFAPGGDAIQALRLVVARRKSVLGLVSSPSQLNTPPRLRKWASMHQDQNDIPKFSPTENGLNIGLSSDPIVDSSPIFASSVSNATLLDNSEIRCACGVKVDCGTLMVQCDACNKWLHMKCEGLRRKKSLPDVFICSFCNGSRSALKTRTRDHSFKSARLDHASSPLSRKSSQIF